MSADQNTPRAAVERLRRARRVLFTTHMSPDGDALGSELALVSLATRMGATCRITNHDPAPATLGELPGIAAVAVAPTVPADFPDAYDLVVTVECPDIDRPGIDGLDRLPILNIDHHRANPRYGEVNYVDEEAPAVGEMVWQMFDAAGLAPTAADATNMYVALSTDTGDFRYQNATARAFRAAAAMVDAGAEPAQVAEWIHAGRKASSVRLLGEALHTLDLRCNGRLAVMWIDRPAFERAQAAPEDTDDLINVPRSIAGVQVVVFLKEWQPGTIRVSLRSKGDLDVRQIAAAYGGGGHTNASGCTLAGDLAAATRDLTAGVARLLGDA